VKRNFLTLFSLIVVGSLIACQAKSLSKPTTADAQAALSQAGSLPTMGAKVEFLLKETKGFLDTEKYDDAARLAEHIIELEPANEEARRLARKAYEKTMGNMVGN